jgi:hypothetical protein
VNGFIGGAFGKGLNDNVTASYEWLIDDYNLGDDIFIFCFSRGAYTARSLPGSLRSMGCLRAAHHSGSNSSTSPTNGRTTGTFWQLQRANSLGELKDATVEEMWLVKYSQPINIKVVAVGVNGADRMRVAERVALKKIHRQRRF